MKRYKEGRKAQVQCRLCESTRRLLRAAREHKENLEAHDQQDCDACKIWTSVRKRYTHLQRIKLANNLEATLRSEHETKISAKELLSGSCPTAKPPTGPPTALPVKKVHFFDESTAICEAGACSRVCIHSTSSKVC